MVKLTAIVQRYISTSQTISGADSLLSESEKQQLIEIAQTTLTHELEDGAVAVKLLAWQSQARQWRLNAAKAMKR